MSKRANENAGKYILLAALFLLPSGCASKYAMRAEQSPVALQWPFPPQQPKIVYSHSFSGFGRGKGAESVLKVITGQPDKSNDSFALPVSIATGVDGRIAVADMGRHCVHLFVPEKQKYFRIYSGEGNKVVSPVSVVFDQESNLYVSDSATGVFAFNKEGKFLSLFKQFGEEVLKRPTGLAYDPGQKILYVADTLQNKIFAFRKNGELAFAFGEKGVEEGEFNFPTHLFWSPTGHLYVTDSMNFRIQIFDPSGVFVTSFGNHGDGSGDLAMPKGIAADQAGVVYVVDALFDTVQLFDNEGRFLLNLGGRGTDFGQFWIPSGIFINERNELYVCDTYNRRIQVFRLTGGMQ